MFLEVIIHVAGMSFSDVKCRKILRGLVESFKFEMTESGTYAKRARLFDGPTYFILWTIKPKET